MVEFISENNKKNLILFVHGFTGGKETWLTNSEGKKIPDYLLEVEIPVILTTQFQFKLTT